MTVKDAITVKSTNGSEFIVRIRPRGEPTYVSVADYGPAILADLWGGLLHYTVFRRRWWVEAFPPPRPLRSRFRWAELATSEIAARERMQVLAYAITSGSWVPGTNAPPPGVASGDRWGRRVG